MGTVDQDDNNSVEKEKGEKKKKKKDKKDKKKRDKSEPSALRKNDSAPAMGDEL
jgi:hypothetical protein